MFRVRYILPALLFLATAAGSAAEPVLPPLHFPVPNELRDESGSVVRLIFAFGPENGGDPFRAALFPELDRPTFRNDERLNRNEELIQNADGSPRCEPFRTEWLRELRSLRSLDLSGVHWLQCGGEEFPVLRRLDMNTMRTSGLSRLRMPELEILDLGRISPFDPNEKLSFRQAFTIKNPPVPTVPGTPKEALPPLPKLKYLRLDWTGSADFDYNSLKGLPLETLSMFHYDGTELPFLAGMPLKKLALGGPFLKEDALRVLTGLPLEELTLEARACRNYGFLRGLKLKKLNLILSSKGDFSLELLRGMPLESLRLVNCYDGNPEPLRGMKLRELILTNSRLGDPELLVSLPLENLVLEQCYFDKPEVLEAIGRISALRRLHVGSLFVPDKKGPSRHKVLRSPPWEQLNKLRLEALSVRTDRIDFLKEHAPGQLKIQPLAANTELSLEPLAGKAFDLLIFGSGKTAGAELRKWKIRAKHSSACFSPFFRGDIFQQKSMAPPNEIPER